MPPSPEILDYVLGIEAKAEPHADHAHFAQLFTKAADELAEDDPRRPLVVWELQLHRYHLSQTEPQKGLTPFLETEGRAYPPSVEAVPEEAVAYFEQRLSQTSHPVAKARLADFLWLRFKGITFADTAIAAYVDAAQAVLPSTRGRSIACDYLARATFLALSLKRDHGTLLATIRSVAARFLVDEDGHLAALIEATSGVIDKDAKLSEWLFEQTVAFAGRKRSAPDQSRILERHLLEALTTLTTIRRDRARASALRLQIARSFEDEARERESEGGLIQSAILSDAIKTYQDLGMADDVDRLKPLLHQALQKAGENTHPISTEFRVPNDVFRKQVEAYLAHGEKLSPVAHLHTFAVSEGYWPAWSEIVERTAELIRRFPLEALVTKVTITHDGRPFERPGDPKKALEFNEIERYTQDLTIQLALSRRKVEMFRERQAWNEDLLMQALSKGALFDEEVLKAAQPGIRAFEEGRHWEALHVLVPQIERIIRKLAKSVGAEVFRYKSDTGELHWHSLKTLLAEPRVTQVLGMISPDLARELGYLFIDSRGWNLRDDLSHGILSPHTNSESFSLLCVITLLTLSTLARQDQAEGAAADAPSKASTSKSD